MEAMEFPVPDAHHRTVFFFLSTERNFGKSKYTLKCKVKQSYRRSDKIICFPKKTHSHREQDFFL